MTSRPMINLILYNSRFILIKIYNKSTVFLKNAMEKLQIWWQKVAQKNMDSFLDKLIRDLFLNGRII